MVINEVRKRVIEWEKKNWTPYPWRVDRTPYKVLIAELLLKRTTRQAVAREYPKFIQKFPDFNAIYSAPMEEVEEAFKHLGLYKQRAKQLKQLAEVIIRRYRGRVPDRWEDLVALPGIGIYLAGAVLSFGYGKKAPVLDSNVIRLLMRLTGIKAKRHEDYLRILWKLVPDEEHDYFNYGLIDLGALVCHYKRPRCDSCPLKEFCVYYLRNTSKGVAEYFENIYKELFYGVQKKLF
ncbi:MAG: A/G-specific adenine glycosylase [Thermoprotei archaeon]|nr:MAG: A/G-specific adenine glycosylase [Thermoprotei archaeon]